MSNLVTFKDVVMSADPENVLVELMRLYPDQTELVENYANVLKFLRESSPIENTDGMYIVIEKMYDECQLCEGRIRGKEELCTNCTKDKGEEYLDISGWKEGGDPSTYAIEFTPWEEWLGLYIKEDTLSQYSKEEIVVHCMWEMTFVSFDREKIKEFMDDLDKMSKEIEEDIKNGNMSKYKTWEDLKKELELEFGDEDEDNEPT